MQLYHHVFLSYSRQDYHAMLQVHNFLVYEGLHVWVDKRGIEPGDQSWKLEIENGIKHSGCLVILLSPDAAKSKWVREELDFAQAQGKKVFPVLVKGDETNAIPFGLTTTQRIDMRLGLSEIPPMIKSIRSHLGIPEPPPPAPPSTNIKSTKKEPSPKNQKSSSQDRSIFLGIFITGLLLYILYLGLKPNTIQFQLPQIQLPQIQIPGVISREKSVTYEQGTLKVLNQRTNITGNDLLRRTNIRIQPSPSGMYYYAIELEFECHLAYCDMPPEAGMVLTFPNDGQPAYPLNYLFLPNESILQPVGFGVKTRGWIIFSMAEMPENLIINPGNNLEKQQIMVLN